MFGSDFVEPRQALAAVIAGDEDGLRRLAELLAPYLPVSVAASEDRWMNSHEAAGYAGTTPRALHKAMAAREVHFEQDVPGGKAWFKRADIDAWRRGERLGSRLRRHERCVEAAATVAARRVGEAEAASARAGRARRLLGARWTATARKRRATCYATRAAT
jgi:hypothetical protein